MHLIVPFASVMSEAGRAAGRALVLPNLARILGGMDMMRLEPPVGADREAPELSLTPPHEHVQARAWGLPVTDGQWPWAALEAAERGLATAERAWGRLTLAHWQLGTEQLTMLDPRLLALDAASGAACLDAIRPLFESEGFEFHAGAGSQALLAHPRLAGLPCASLDRVIGRNVDLWLPADPRARLVRRLQNEAQMLLHRHPLNEAREEQGALPVNSFWLDGCGVAPAGAGAAPLGITLDERLRTPALNEDWFAWSRAFAQLDEGPLAQAVRVAQGVQAGHGGPPLTLSLCGERYAVTLTARPHTPWQRLRGLWADWRRPPMSAVHRLLESL